MTPAKRSHLLPAGFDQPRWLFWLFVLPQLVLLAVQYSQWHLVSGEMSPSQQGKALTLAAIIGVLVLSQLALAVLLVMRRGRIPLAACVAYLLAHIGYLWGVLAWMDNILPDAVRSWILPETEYLFYPFALVMPALVYCGIRLASILLPVSRAVDIGGTVAGLVGIPVLWFLALQAAMMVRMPSLVLAVLFVGSTTLVLLLFLRALLYVHEVLSKHRIQAWILPLLAGIVAPIGGLLLNRTIPFPYDFQSPYVYGLTLLNGVLLLAAVTLPVRPRWSFVLLAPSYGFSLYFFLVFLPFLPLSLLAMIAAGAGFLILAPTFLFVLHTRLLLAKGQALAAAGGRLRTVFLGILLAGLLPAGLLVSAFQDRVQLHRAMAYVWEPDDLQAQAHFRAAPVLRALQRVRNRKAGVYYPFLSEAYQRIVFDGMTLPERKIDTLEMLLGGARVPREAPERSFFLGMWSGRQRARSGRVRLPQRNVELVDVAVVHEPVEDGFVASHVTLQLANQGGPNSEYVVDLQVPEGGLITDYWLDVEGERVPGRLFERKTALWVYHMIRDVVRQDPGLLYYQSPTRLRLQVFPFGAGQTRETGWTVLYPQGQRPELQIGDQRVALDASSVSPGATVLGTQGDAGTAWVWPQGIPGDVVPHQREAYAHLIVDHSVHGYTNLAELAASLPGALAEVAPHMDAFTLTFANFASVDVVTDPLPLDQLTEILVTPPDLPRQGGFDPERVIRRQLRIMEANPDRYTQSIPVFIVLTPQHTNTVWMEESRFVAHVASDHPWYYLLDNHGLHRKSFDQNNIETVTRIDPPVPVHLFRQGSVATTLPTGASSAWRFLVEAQGPLQRFDPQTATFVDGKVQWLDATSTYARGLALWTDWFGVHGNPAKESAARLAMIQRAREQRILFPLVAFIVVENKAQWRMLERKEKQTADARRGLEHDEFLEAPAPGIWLLLPVAWWLKRRRHLQAVKSCRAK